MDGSSGYQMGRTMPGLHRDVTSEHVAFWDSVVTGLRVVWAPSAHRKEAATENKPNQKHAGRDEEDDHNPVLIPRPVLVSLGLKRSIHPVWSGRSVAHRWQPWDPAPGRGRYLAATEQ
ncbi:hypothetical protein DPEC_G00312450 [Dallia pectoralis]|uniref:Uncharacterized protein n=1 Tax=Dallia pectoralis TaxID=75939 RepID=A0ACC2FBK7_DALPE|nr:hypothetical protein DPEC_G00312450 [Dallia pectoralis]